MVVSARVEVDGLLQPREWFVRQSDACVDEEKIQRPFEARWNRAIAARAGQGYRHTDIIAGTGNMR